MDDSPATTALSQVIAVFPAVIRLTCGLAGACVALSVRTPPAYMPLLAIVVGVLTGWSLLFSRWTLRRGLTTAAVVIDVSLTVITCLLTRHLVAAEVLPGQVSWVAILASTSVIVAQLGLPASRSIPAGLLIVGAYAFGVHLAGNDAEATAHTATLAVQTFSTAGLAYLGRRGSRLADLAFADYQRVSRQALVARAARAAERQHNRNLHDTVLSTLTVVGLGAVPARSRELRERVNADLRTLAALAEARAQAGSGGTARGLELLDLRLRAALDQLPHQRLAANLDQCAVPPAVADAITGSLAAALSNVERHAPDAEATVRLRRAGDTIVLEVTDDGPGFDPAIVPAHRYGLRESIHGRMAAIGGRAEVDSSPGHGTRVRLEWAMTGDTGAAWTDATTGHDTTSGAGARSGETSREAVAAVSVTSERGIRIAAVAIAFVWLLAVNLPATVMDWSSYRQPWLAGAGWLLFAVVGVIAAAHLLRGTPLPVWPSVAVLLLVDAAIFAVVPGPRLFDGIDWAWGTIGWFAMLVLWGRPVSRLVGVLIAGSVMALIAVLTKGESDAADLSRWVMYVYGTMVLQIALAVAARALGELAGSTAATAAAHAAVEAEREAAGRALRERQERLSGISRTAGAVLAELADGQADPTDPAVQSRCALEAARLRRLIAESDDVPDPLLHELRACVDIAERRGLRVEFVAVGIPPALPVGIRRRLAEPHADALATARNWARLTVVADPDDVAISLVTPTAGSPETEPAETETAGTETAETETAETGTAGTETAGIETAETGTAGTETAGTGTAGTGVAETGTAGMVGADGMVGAGRMAGSAGIGADPADIPGQVYGDDLVKQFHEQDEELIWTQTRWRAT